MTRTGSAVAFAVAALVTYGQPAEAAEIKVLSSGAIKEAYLALVPMFEKKSGMEPG
ncbi:MAG: hypothetical protein IT537_13640 [Hyphomicrobiales bacterium]|nr:hypothetical protein [Hyphomicrobiales bacterium]